MEPVKSATLLLVVWTVDSLTTLLPVCAPPEAPVARMAFTCARNEYESGQIAVRANQSAAIDIAIGDLALRGGDGRIAAEHVQARFERCIPIKHNTYYTPDEELIAKAPAEIPDVLVPGNTMTVEADRTQGIWVTVHVPEAAAPGVYAGEATIGAGDTRVAVPIEATVLDFAIPRERHLYVTNWFSEGNIAKSAGGDRGSDAYYRMLEVYAENMAAHRQNVFWAPWNTIGVTKGADGSLSFDYGAFDRYIETFVNAGVDGRIELQATAHHGEGGWESKDIVLMNVTAKDVATGGKISLPPEEGLGPLLADIERHLESRGWLDRAMIHLSDEPQLENIASYKRAAAFIHEHAPRLKRIEAIEGRGFLGALDVWVPKLSHLRNWYPFYDAARKDGAELWYYICCHPTGRYMNRFLDYAPIKTRLLHWLNYRYGLTGYLHWGFNFWGEDPFGPPSKELPPGDCNIVYPGPADNPFSLLDSIRWEVQRDSIEDYECLWLLEQRAAAAIAQLGPAAAPFDPAGRSREICATLVESFERYERNSERFADRRRMLMEEIAEMPQEPLILCETGPGEDLPVFPGPTAIEICGVTRPGATLTMNGKAVEVREDGAFQARSQFWDDHCELRFRVETEAGSKEFVRRFESSAASSS